MSKNIKHNDPEESVENALNKTEQLIEKHKNNLIYAVIAILGISAIGFAYQHLYRKPLKEEALTQTFVAEQHFRADSFALAMLLVLSKLLMNTALHQLSLFIFTPGSVNFSLAISKMQYLI